MNGEKLLKKERLKLCYLQDSTWESDERQNETDMEKDLDSSECLTES